MIPVEVSYPGVGAIIRWSYVISEGIVPSICILEAIPQTTLTAAPATLQIKYGNLTRSFPDMVVMRESLTQANAKRGFRMKLILQDRRWKWQHGRVSGIYNVRLPDGTVDPTTRKTPAELATILLTAMGERGFDVSRMPIGMFPPAKWDNVNPAEALDKLCRYVACKITGGETGKVTIWPLGMGKELPEGKYINPTYTLTPQGKPKALVLQGGNTVFQSRLKLAAIGRNDNISLPLATKAPYAASILDSPFSYPGIAVTQQRTDAFQSLFKVFYTNSQADGTHVLPGCNVQVSKGTQYRLLNVLIDTWLNSDNVRLTVIPGVLGKFWPMGDDADECTSLIGYNGHFSIDASRNLVSFPYALWNLTSTGAIKAPEMYLYVAYHVLGADGEYAGLRRPRAIGGTGGERVLYRPELTYAVRHAYDANNNIIATVTTLAQAEAEAKAYLDAFERSYLQSDQRDIEWAGIEDMYLDGRISQLKMQGGVKEACYSRASRMSEFDVCGPGSQEQRRTRFVDSLMERPNATA